MTLRNERVRKTLMKEIADIIQRDIRDPRITGIVSILDVEVAHDNSFAKVYYSIFVSDESKKEEVAHILEEYSSKIRYELGKRIRLRLTPELRFILDNSIERGMKITKLIDEISKKGE